jgi:hypothetical protein
MSESVRGCFLFVCLCTEHNACPNSTEGFSGYIIGDRVKASGIELMAQSGRALTSLGALCLSHCY